MDTNICSGLSARVKSAGGRIEIVRPKVVPVALTRHGSPVASDPVAEHIAATLVCAQDIVDLDHAIHMRTSGDITETLACWHEKHMLGVLQ
jgi:hypothetical protein